MVDLSYTKKAVYNSMLVFSFGVVSAVVSYIFRLYLARSTSIEFYGFFYSVIAFFSLLLVFTNFGLNQAMIKYIPEFLAKKNLSNLKGSIYLTFFIHTITYLAVGLLSIVFSGFLAQKYFGVPQYQSLVIIYGIYFILTPVLFLWYNLSKGFQKMNYYSFTETLQNVILLVGTFIMIRFGFGLYAPFYAQLFVIVMPILFIPFFIKKFFPDFFKVKANLSKYLTKKLFVFGGSSIIIVFSVVIFSNVDTFLLTLFMSLKDVGLYQAAYPTTKILSKFTFSLTIVLLPLVSELWTRNKKSLLMDGVSSLYKYGSIIFIPISFTMMVFPEIILRLLFGAEFEPASAVLRILSLAALINVSGSINGSILSGIGKPLITGKIFIVAAIINIILDIILIPLIGINGAAIGTLIAYIYISFMSFVYMKREVVLAFDTKSFFKTLFAGAIFIVLLSLLKKFLVMSVIPEAIVSISISVIIYISLIFLLKVLTFEELRDILKRIY